MPNPSPSPARTRVRLGPTAILPTCAVLVALAAVALVGIATRHGAAVSPDSATYVAGARNLAAGAGYSDFALVPITDWPPGLSMTLAGLHWTGVGALAAARWLNAGALGAVVLLSFALGRRYLNRVWLALAAAMIAGFAPAMLGVFSFVWSEPVFCALCLGALMVLETLARNPRASWWLVGAAGVLAGTAFAYRYAGMVVLAVAVIGVVVGAWGTGVPRVLGRGAAVAGIGLALPAAIIARNLVHGSLTGQRIPSSQTLHGLLVSSEHFLAGWVLADHHPGRALGVIMILAVTCLTALGVVLRIRAFGLHGSGTRALVPLVAFVVGYAAYICVTEFATAIDPPDDRIASPVLAPAAILVMVAVDALLDRCPARIAATCTAVASVVLTVWIAAMLVVSIVHARSFGRAGVRFAADGVTIPAWTDSSFMRAVRALPADSVLYSNQPGGVYLATGREPIAYSGQPTAYPPIPVELQTTRLIAQMVAARGPVYLVWSLPNYRPHIVTPRDLAARGVQLTPVLVTPRGIIERVAG